MLFRFKGGDNERGWDRWSQKIEHSSCPRWWGAWTFESSLVTKWRYDSLVGCWFYGIFVCDDSESLPQSAKNIYLENLWCSKSHFFWSVNVEMSWIWVFSTASRTLYLRTIAMISADLFVKRCTMFSEVSYDEIHCLRCVIYRRRIPINSKRRSEINLL